MSPSSSRSTRFLALTILCLATAACGDSKEPAVSTGIKPPAELMALPMNGCAAGAETTFGNWASSVPGTQVWEKTGEDQWRLTVASDAAGGREVVSKLLFVKNRRAYGPCIELEQLVEDGTPRGSVQRDATVKKYCRAAHGK